MHVILFYQVQLFLEAVTCIKSGDYFEALQNDQLEAECSAFQSESGRQKKESGAENNRFHFVCRY